MRRISALLELTVLVLLGNFMAAGIPVAHGQKTDPFEFPPEVVLDEKSLGDWIRRSKNLSSPISDIWLALEGKSEEGLAMLKERMGEPCDNQSCNVEKARHFIYFIRAGSNDWSDDQYAGLMREVLVLVKRLTGVARHDLLVEWYLVNALRAGGPETWLNLRRC